MLEDVLHYFLKNTWVSLFQTQYGSDRNYGFVPLLNKSMKPINCLGSLQLLIVKIYCSLTKKAASRAMVGCSGLNAKKMRLGTSLSPGKRFPRSLLITLGNREMFSYLIPIMDEVWNGSHDEWESWRLFGLSQYIMLLWKHCITLAAPPLHSTTNKARLPRTEFIDSTYILTLSLGVA